MKQQGTRRMDTDARQAVELLIAEDDSEDRILIREALEEAQLDSSYTFVKDGQELVDRLYRRQRRETPDLPVLILLDLNMPRKDGRRALADIKNDPMLRAIPVIVLTTSCDEEEILQAYQIGVSTYMRKPASFDKLTEMIETIGRYWLQFAELPPPSGQRDLTRPLRGEEHAHPDGYYSFA